MKRYPSAFLAAILTLLLLDALVTSAQTKPAFAPDKMDTVLYGAVYYTEYMPYDRLEREAQLLTVKQIPGTGLAVTIDVGDPKDVHPHRKAQVGERLAL
jgi:hypothetical protein